MFCCCCCLVLRTFAGAVSTFFTDPLGDNVTVVFVLGLVVRWGLGGNCCDCDGWFFITFFVWFLWTDVLPPSEVGGALVFFSFEAASLEAFFFPPTPIHDDSLPTSRLGFFLLVEVSSCCSIPCTIVAFNCCACTWIFCSSCTAKVWKAWFLLLLHSSLVGTMSLLVLLLFSSTLMGWVLFISSWYLELLAWNPSSTSPPDIHDMSDAPIHAAVATPKATLPSSLLLYSSSSSVASLSSSSLSPGAAILASLERLVVVVEAASSCVFGW